MDPEPEAEEELVVPPRDRSDASRAEEAEEQEAEEENAPVPPVLSSRSNDGREEGDSVMSETDGRERRQEFIEERPQLSPPLPE